MIGRTIGCGLVTSHYGVINRAGIEESGGGVVKALKCPAGFDRSWVHVTRVTRVLSRLSVAGGTLQNSATQNVSMVGETEICSGITNMADMR